jgi:hypothetical protein
MKKILLIVILMFACAAAIGNYNRDHDIKTKTAEIVMVMPEKEPARSMSKSEAELRLSMKLLWESRAILLRHYVVSAMSNSRDEDEAKAKLLKNAGDLGASIRPYHGYFAGGMLSGFLKKDVALTAKVIKSLKSGKKEDIEWDRNAWYANAYLLAGFFAITRNQTMQYLTDTLYKHLDLTLGEINAILKKDRAKDLEYYEKDKAHMIAFSDVLVDGLIKQFPKRFKD